MSEQSGNIRATFFRWEYIVLLLIVGIVIAVAIPNPIGPKRSGQAWNSHVCINNLRQIDAAANEFALEKHLSKGDRINFPNDLTPYIKLNKDNKIPPCPSGGIYRISKVGETPTCSLGPTVTPAHVLP